MEDHLLEIFGGHDTREILSTTLSSGIETIWSKEALSELEKIPGFVRGKIKRNTEKFAKDNYFDIITLEVLYSAKEALNT